MIVKFIRIGPENKKTDIFRAFNEIPRHINQ